METIFITIHDLSLDARIKFCSHSIEEILGYRPNEVKGKSCWEYFHPDEIPFARAIHGRGLDLEKAAALNYCRIRHKDGSWIGCECVFTVVYDVLVASTAIYQRGEKAQRRAVEGSTVRRVFSSSPRDPRYHMLSYISNKFTQSIRPDAREPRAALILNRFTRTSTIMFATNGVEQILGFSPTQLVGKSFYYCISENCLSDAVRTLESAKGNDSIAYLRFYFRDPNLPDPPHIEQGDSDSDESDGGGVVLSRGSSVSRQSPPVVNGVSVPDVTIREPELDGTAGPRNDSSQASSARHDGLHGLHHSSSSGASTDMENNGSVFDRPHQATRSSASSITPQETPPDTTPMPGAIEIEAVVSCSSDGLVVVLRRAQEIVPTPSTNEQPSFPNGLFASPWASEPVLPDGLPQATPAPSISAMSEPAEAGFMSAIRDVAVFAWSLTGINGALIEKASGPGKPSGESIPPGGIPIWDPNAPVGQNDYFNGFSGGTHRRLQNMGDSGGRPQVSGETSSSSDDEIVWRRAPVMPLYKRPKRRANQAFDTDEDSTDNGGVCVQERRRRKFENGERQDSSNSM
ncbi:hypothetical protein LTR70_008573 [Exophiala xenobiotica]|uniref:PAS domain-containing protein n=1 Tax=Lithohypha guttulata TaxID=1690604 RepID=A0ABR0JXX5_9EURO|nr:hypothetical protein LTR24_009114 [Lithohypha guttulata]KAK5311779.1 hypothetical protein LTR70_008573 [Exophiala xenobiotica]